MLLGAHFSATNPSKAVILTFDAPTNEGGALCLGYCPCSRLLDEATVKKLQGDEALALMSDWAGQALAVVKGNAEAMEKCLLHRANTLSDPEVRAK